MDSSNPAATGTVPMTQDPGRCPPEPSSPGCDSYGKRAARHSDQHPPLGGWAQIVADFIFWRHFIKPVYVIEQFAIERAAILLAVTAAAGFVLGAAFACV
jgi:hypothetical protein